jgi:hypothetical protein
VPNSFQKDAIIIDNLGGRNIFPTAWKHNKCLGLLSWQPTQQSPAAEETQDIKTQGFQLLRNICLNNIYIQLCNARM